MHRNVHSQVSSLFIFGILSTLPMRKFITFQMIHNERIIILWTFTYRAFTFYLSYTRRSTYLILLFYFFDYIYNKICRKVWKGSTILECTTRLVFCNRRSDLDDHTHIKKKLSYNIEIIQSKLYSCLSE